MKKLIALREWLSVAEAGSYLSTALEDEITEADILRLTLDGRLKLSVHFVNHAKARRGSVVGYEDVQWYEPDEFPLLYREDTEGERVKVMRSMDVGGGKYLNLDDKIVTVSGVWDLPMLGAERLDVEHAYQNLTSGPPVSLICLDGTFVESYDGKTICQLQESLDENNFERNSYYPAAKLPDDGVFVVRTASLREFERMAATSADAQAASLLKQFATNSQTKSPAPIEQELNQKSQKEASDWGEIASHVDDKFIASLFDPVGKEQLEAMFPDNGKWAQYANYAPRNGLKAVRVGRGKFNPYLAAKWWMDTQGPAGWTWERCLRKLAKNLPARSSDSKHLLTGDFD